MAKSCPVPRNPVFTRSGDSVFENVTIWGKLCADNVSLPGATEIENLIVNDSSTFFGDANFKEDVTIDGTLTASIIDTDFLTVFKRFNVGTGGTLFNADTRSDRVGIATTEPIEKFQINSVEDETFIVTETGIVAIGKTNPESNISGIDTAGQGQLKLDIDGSVSISRNIYDSVGTPGVN